MDPVSVFDHPAFDAHEEVVFAHDAATGLRAIIAIHSTRLGPALGGCRIQPYAAAGDALADVLRLSRGMTLKAALAGLALGGGKAVIWTAPDRPKTPALMAAFGHAVDRLGGRYITAEDAGADVADMETVRAVTPHVAGTAADVGDPSPHTARGVFLCLEAAHRHRTGRSLDGAHVALKGLGNVGFKLAALLDAAGARLTVADVDAARASRARARFGAATAGVAEIHTVAADVFAPCALGADLSETRIAALGAPVVCGAANNQLATPEDDARLAARGVLYCPDYLVNAGGLVAVASGRLGLGADDVAARIEALPRRLAAILERAAGGPTGAVADALAAERLEAAPRDAA